MAPLLVVAKKSALASFRLKGIARHRRRIPPPTESGAAAWPPVRHGAFAVIAHRSGNVPAVLVFCCQGRAVSQRPTYILGFYPYSRVGLVGPFCGPCGATNSQIVNNIRQFGNHCFQLRPYIAVFLTSRQKKIRTDMQSG